MDAEEKAFLERAAAWNKGKFDAMPQPEDPDDVTLAQPKLPTTLRSKLRSTRTNTPSS